MCEPSLSYSRRWLPSLNKNRSSSVSSEKSYRTFVAAVAALPPRPSIVSLTSSSFPARASRRFLQQLHDAGQRDPHPVRTVVQLVCDLVERLLQKKRIEQHLHLIKRLRQDRRQVRGLHVAAEVRSRRPGHPVARPAFDALDVLRPDNAD